MTNGEVGSATDPRVAAFRILTDVRHGQFADRSATRRLSALDGTDRALARELAYGTIRMWGRLDAELAITVSRPLDRLDPEVHDWLRLGLYQIRHTRVPDHAAVDQTVQAVKRAVGAGAGGLVNAVLRRAARTGVPADAFPDEEADRPGHVAAWGSHPRWLVERWLARWPLASVRRLIEYDNRAPAVTVRTLDRASDLEVELRPAPGVRLEAVAGWRGMFRLVEGGPADALASLRAVVQDPAAASVVDYAGEFLRGPVLDVCAAPGGKAIGLAAANPTAKPFVASDVSATRLGRLLEAVARTGSDVCVVRMDGRAPALASAETVLLDAPCTGTGVLSRRPDARWRVTEHGLESLTALQARLLDGVAGITAPGGLLVYATCSLEPEENEDQVDAFLLRHPDFRRDAEAPGPVKLELVDERGDLRVEPFKWGTDGAFASRLRKAAGRR